MATFYFDGDKLQECPYQPIHRVLSRRMLAHITKCAHDPRSPKLMECPFNTLHRVFPEEFNTHVMECRDNRQTIREMLNPLVQPPSLVTPQPRIDSSEDPWKADAEAKPYILPGLVDKDADNDDEIYEVDPDCFISQQQLYKLKPAQRKRMYASLTEAVIKKQAQNEREAMTAEEARELGLEIKPKVEFVIDTNKEPFTSGEPSASREVKNDTEDEDSTVPKKRRISDEPCTDPQTLIKNKERPSDDEEEDNKEFVKKQIRALEPGCFRTRSVERPFVKRQNR